VEGAIALDAGVVDEDIDGPELALNLGEYLPGAGTVADVGLDGEGGR
jgi:hypothetical protein